MPTWISLFAAAFICLAAPVRADEAAKMEKAQRVYDLVNTEEALSLIALDLAQGALGQIEAALAQNGKSLSSGDRNEFIARSTVFLLDRFEKAEPEFVSIYAEELTEQELDLLFELYNEPEMAELLAKMPKISSRMTPAMMAIGGDMVNTIIPAMRREGFLNTL